jgi:hypothetical protein
MELGATITYPNLLLVATYPRPMCNCCEVSHIEENVAYFTRRSPSLLCRILSINSCYFLLSYESLCCRCGWTPQSRYFIQWVRDSGSTYPTPVTIPSTITVSGKSSNLKWVSEVFRNKLPLSTKTLTVAVFHFLQLKVNK